MVMCTRCPIRLKGEQAEHDGVAAQLEAANERFKEYERRDVRLREDVRHLGAKAKKLADRLARDAARAQACAGNPETQKTLVFRAAQCAFVCVHLRCLCGELQWAQRLSAATQSGRHADGAHTCAPVCCLKGVLYGQLTNCTACMPCTCACM